MPNLTLSMIVKNEEKYLHNCLESVKDIVDEIVIVDTGSTDKTIEIAKNFNAKIYHFEWINDFSSARNFALKKSSGNYILYLDADERISQDSIIELKKIILSNENLGVKCSVISIDDKKGISQSMRYTRLFRNNKSIEFSGNVHEQIEKSLIENNYKIIDSDIKIFHYGYNVSTNEIKFKAQRNLEILLEEYKKNKSSYNSYQIANSYLILGDFENSVKFYKEALAGNNLKNDFKSVCYMQLADYEMRNNNFQSAKKHIESGLKINPNQTLLNIIAAQIYTKLNDSTAINYCKKAFQLNYDFKRNINMINEQNIFEDDKKIIYEGILVSLKFNDEDSTNFFLEKMIEFNFSESKLLRKLINDEINNDEILEMTHFIDENNIGNYLNIFGYLKNVDLKLEIFSKIYDKFSSNVKYLNEFGIFLLNINQINEAKIIFESILENNEYEDSAIFYLASIYVKLNEINKLKKLLIIVENKITSKTNSNTSKDKFRILAQKISPIVSFK